MRLTPQEVGAIKHAVAQTFGADAVVRLFGSRMHDHLRGGDIDLHVETKAGRPPAGTVAAFRTMLAGTIGDRAVDLVFQAHGDAMRPIDRAAHAGIAL